MAKPFDENSKPAKAVDCPSCGKKFRWKPEAAGRTFKCGSCLEKFRFPDKPGLRHKPAAKKPDTSAFPSAPPSPFDTPTPTPTPAPTPAPATPSATDQGDDFDGYELDLEHSTFAEEQAQAKPAKKTDADSSPAPAASRPEDEDGFELKLEDDVFGSDASSSASGISSDHTGPDDELSKLPPPILSTGGGSDSASATNDKCPACGGRVKIGAVICINCGYNFKDGAKIKTEINATTPAGGNSAHSEIPAGLLKRIKEKESATEESEGDDKKRDFVYPLIAFILGLLLVPLLSFMAADDEVGGLIVMLVIFAITIFIQVPFMVLGAFVVAKFADVEFGPLGPAILKLAAIALLPGLIGELLGIGFNSVLDVGGGIVGWMASLTLTMGMLSYFFRFDLAETWSVVVAFAVLRFIITLLGGMLILLMFV